MMYLEYDWTFHVYRSRFGETPTAIHGVYSWPSLKEARAAIKIAGMKLGRKTDTRTWIIVLATLILLAFNSAAEARGGSHGGHGSSHGSGSHSNRGHR